MSGPTPDSTPADLYRLNRGRRMPIQFHADIAERIYSGLALGLFAYLAMQRDGSEFSLRQMQRTHKEGRDAWSGAMAELIELGLVARIRWRDSAGRWRTRYYLAHDHPFDEADIAEIREVHGQDCLIECSPELSNTPIQVSSRVSKRPRKADRAALDHANGVVAPVSAIAAAGRPSAAIAAAGATSDDAALDQGRGVAAIAGTHKEGRTISPSFPPTPHDERPAPPQVPTRREGWDPRCDEVLRHVMKAWPSLTRSDQAKLMALINTRLGQGHPQEQLIAVLTANTEGAKRPVGVLAARLNDLPEPTRSGPAPWCGACDENRAIEHEGALGEIVSHWCPRCHPGGRRSTCVDCQEHLVTHPSTDWCGACTPEKRTIYGKPCPTCHPTNQRASRVA